MTGNETFICFTSLSNPHEFSRKFENTVINTVIMSIQINKMHFIFKYNIHCKLHSQWIQRHNIASHVIPLSQINNRKMYNLINCKVT